MDIIPTRGRHQDAGTPPDASETDTDAEPDAETSPIDAGPDADAIQPTDAGSPVPPIPACEGGTLRGCTFTPAGVHGFIAAFVAQGEYVYWLELGSMDVRDNYQYDGALVRVHIGSWEREEVVSGLDFYDEGQRRIQACASLRAFRGYVVWDECNYSGVEAQYVRLTETPQRARLLPGPLDIQSCAFDGDTAYCLLYYNLYRWDWTLETDWTLLGANLHYEFGQKILYSEQTLYVQTVDFDIDRIDLKIASPTAQRLSPRTWLADVLPGDKLIGMLPGDWIGAAQYDGGSSLEWTSIAGPGEYIGSMDGWLYWWDKARGEIRLGRARIDGSDQSIFAAVNLTIQDKNLRVQLSQTGVFMVPGSPQTDIESLHFEPFPADPGP